MIDHAAAHPAETRRLDGRERAVIARSRRDGRASLVAPARWWRWTRRLPDARLEALRRYVVLLRNGGDDWASEAANALVRHGYAIDQIAHARWLVASERTDPPRSPAYALALLLAKAALLVALLVIHGGRIWPLALVLGLAALVASIAAPPSRWDAWERNFTVV